jgi:16S rRNA C1402 (ribose-2'-O) methylase RsmI
MPPKNIRKVPTVIPEMEVAEDSEPIPTPIQEKKTRKMTPEALEKLQKARVLALEARRNKAKIESEHKEIKETFGQKVDQISMYKKVKEQVDEDVKKNEIVVINKKLDEMYHKFDGFLQDREKRKQDKAQRKDQKKVSEIARELPPVISQKLLEEELRRQETARFRAKYFGI